MGFSLAMPIPIFRNQGSQWPIHYADFIAIILLSLLFYWHTYSFSPFISEKRV